MGAGEAMPDWLDSVAGPGYTQALFWTFGALLLLALVLVIIKQVRSMTFGTLVAGGRNRKTRLAVMDATAVDANRRLILVRRDDTEHLLLIGGPTDLVVERDIKFGAQRRVTAGGEPQREVAAPQPATPASAPPRRAPDAAPRQAPPAPSRAAPERQPATLPPRNVDAPRASLRPDPPRAAPLSRTDPRPAPAMPAATPFNPSGARTAPSEEFDDELLKELEVSLEETQERPVRRSATPSLDDEMTKLLGELSTPRR